MAPVTVPTDNNTVEPWHTGLLLVATGVAGVAFITTSVAPVSLMQPAIEATTWYTPESATITEFIVGFCKVDVKPLGPVQL